MKRVRLSIVVPCYNEEEALPVFYEAILPVMKDLQSSNKINDFELIFVDDGSKDGTLSQLKLLTSRDSHVKYFSFPAILARKPRSCVGCGKVQVTMLLPWMVDLQDPPSLIPEMLAVVTDEGYDCAGSRRVTRKGEPPVRSFFARPLLSPRALTGFSMLIGLLGISIYKNSTLVAGGKFEVTLVPVLCLLYGCVVFQFAYGVALAEQKQYQEFRTEILLADLSDYAQSERTNKVSFSGSIGLTENVSVNGAAFSLISELMTVVPGGGGIWNDDLLNSYNFKCEDKYLAENPGWPLLQSSYYHDIYGEDNNFFIVLK